MKQTDADSTNRPWDGSPSKVKRGNLTSPRAEAFKKGHRLRRDKTPEDAFDPHKYREIYSETD